MIIRLGLQNHEITSEIHRSALDTQSLVEDLSAAVADLPQEFAGLMKPTDHSERQQIFSDVTAWLKPNSFNDVFARFLDSLDSGSCEWILQKDQFLGWMTSSPTKGHYPLLWVTGRAGSGKTRLATKAIDTLKSSQRLAYFYCDAQDANNRSFLDIVRNWCWQLLGQDQARLREVKSIKDRQQIVSETVLMEVFCVIISGEKDVVLVIDAFDECEAQEQAKIYQKFSAISRLAKVLVFSWPLQGSVRALRKAVPENLIRLEMSEGDTQSDINQFIESRVADLGIYDAFILDEITSMLQSKTNGMFLWVALMIEELQRNPLFDESQYLTILEQAPKDLDELYYQIQARDGYTPLHDAVVEKNQEIIALLISHRASLEAKDSAGRTTLDLAVQYQNSAAMQLLEEAGAISGLSQESDSK
jgi:hypothetical protein